MNQTDKLTIALGSVLDNDQDIKDSKAKVLALESKRDSVLSEAVRVMKCSGKDQVFFRGTIFTLETDPKEDEGNNDVLDISVFEGLVLGNGKDGTND